MEDNYIPRKLLNSELEDGNRKHGRPRKPYTIKENLQWWNIKPELKASHSDRSQWRRLIYVNLHHKL